MQTASQPGGLHAAHDVSQDDVTWYNLLMASGPKSSKVAYRSMPALPTNVQSIDVQVDWRKSFPNVQIEDGTTQSLLTNKLPNPEDDKQSVDDGPERPVKNLLVLSIGWMFYFMAFFSLRSLQSSINHVAGLGLASLACIYAGFLLSCLVTIPIVRRLGTKRILVIGVMCHMVYVAANIQPSFYTIIPSSLLAGFSQVLMWTAQGAYLISLSKAASSRSSCSFKSTASFYFGIFFLFFSLSPVFGSLMTSILMKTLHIEYRSAPFLNETYQWINLTDGESSRNYHWLNVSGHAPDTPTCGVLFCHTESHHDEVFILPLQTRVIIIGAYVISMLLALFIFALFLDDSFDPCPRNNMSALISQLRALLAFVRNPKFLLLAPVIFYIGIQTSFHSGEITKAYVTCLYGMEMVGFAMACFGCSAALSSCFTGYLKRYINRLAIISLGFLINVGCLLVMALWIPTRESLALVLIIVSLWGFSEGIWITHINCTTGLLFPNSIEAAYTAFQFMVALGMVVGYSVSQYLCMFSKLCTVGVFAVLGMSGYGVLKWQLRTARCIPEVS